MTVPATAGRAADSRPRVLLVDDEDSYRRMAGLVLRRVCPLVTAATCEQALGLLEEDAASYMLVLLDVHFGKDSMSGDACLEHIRRRWPFLDVVMLSVDVGGPLVLRAWKAGAQGYIDKVADRNRLPELVAGYLSAAVKRREAEAHDAAARRLREQARHVVDQASRDGAGTDGVLPGPVDLLLRERIADELTRHDGNLRAAADSLHVSYHSLWRKARKFGLTKRRERAPNP